MLVRKRNRDYYYDKFHRGFVHTCIAATIVSGLALVYSGYIFFTRTLPEQKLLLEKKQEELLKEGEDIEDLENVPA